MRAAEALAQCQPPELIKPGKSLTGLEKQKTTSLSQAANSQVGLSHYIGVLIMWDPGICCPREHNHYFEIPVRIE